MKRPPEFVVYFKFQFVVLLLWRGSTPTFPWGKVPQFSNWGG